MGIFPRRLFLYTEKHLVLQAAYKFLTNFLNDGVCGSFLFTGQKTADSFFIYKNCRKDIHVK